MKSNTEITITYVNESKESVSTSINDSKDILIKSNSDVPVIVSEKKDNIAIALDKTIFISGHVNIQQHEFDTHYIPSLDEFIKLKHHVVIGNANGVDTMAYDYLIKKGHPGSLITIYHYGQSGNPTDKYLNQGVQVKTGFTSYTKRDACMTTDSTDDLLWVRPVEETIKLLESNGEVYRPGRISGTEANLKRRHKMKK